MVGVDVPWTCGAVLPCASRTCV